MSTERTGFSVECRYRAFMSYSHAADGKLAPALRNGLQRFATPWNPLRWRNPARSLRVFHDQSTLSATPSLWPSIETALAASEWFILLASPEAARSPWVIKEVRWWCDNRRANQILIAVTEGEIVWNGNCGDFNWEATTALPHQLKGVFLHEPRWIDLRWARSAEQTTVRDPRFQDAIADLAAPLRGVPKDELIGEDIRQRRILNRWRNAGMAGLFCLAVFAAWQWHLADDREKEATRERDKAFDQQARAVTELVRNQLADDRVDVSVAALLDVLPQLNRPSQADARRRIFSSLSTTIATPGIDATFNITGFYQAIAVSSETGLILIAEEDGSVGLWDATAALRVADVVGVSGKVEDIEFSPNGEAAYVLTKSGAIYLWNVVQRRIVRRIETPTPKRRDQTRFSTEGTKLLVQRGKTTQLFHANTGLEAAIFEGVAVIDEAMNLIVTRLDSEIRVYEAGSGKMIRTIRMPDEVSAIGSLTGDEIYAGDINGIVHVIDIKRGKERFRINANPRMLAEGEFTPKNKRPYRLYTSPDRQHLISADDGAIRLWNFETGAHIADLWKNDKPAADVTWLAGVSFVSDGKRFVTQGGGRFPTALWETATGTLVHEFGDTVRDITPSPSGELLLVELTSDMHEIVSAETGEKLYDLHFRAHSGRYGTLFVSDRQLLFHRFDEVLRYSLPPASLQGSSLKGASRRDEQTEFLGEKLIALGFTDGTISIFDAASDRRLWSAQVSAEDNEITKLWASPTGTHLLAATRDSVVLYSLPGLAPKFKHRIDEKTGNHDVVATFSRDGRRLAISFPEENLIWDVEREGVVGDGLSAPESEKRNPIRAMAFDPNGKTLATAFKNGDIRIWDSGSSTAISTAPRNDFIHKLTWTEDGSKLVALSFGAVSVFDTNDIRRPRWTHSSSFPHGRDNYEEIAVARDRVAARTRAGRVFIWQFDSGAPLEYKKFWGLQVPFSRFRGDLLFNSDRTLVACVGDSALVFDSDGHLIFEIQTNVSRAGILASTYLITADASSGLKMWELKTGRLEHEINDFPGSHTIRMDGQLVIGQSSGTASYRWIVLQAGLSRLTAERLPTTSAAKNGGPLLPTDFALDAISFASRRQNKPVEARSCAALAADADDEQSAAPGVLWEEIDTGAAISACLKEVDVFPGNSAGWFHLGRAYGRAGMYSEAHVALARAIALGYSAAMTLMGSMYEQGQGVPMDYRDAVQYYQMASSAGERAGLYDLARALEFGLGLLPIKLTQVR